MSINFLDGIFDGVALGTEMEIVASIEKKIAYINHTGYGVYIADDISIKYGGDFKIVGTFPIPLEEDRIYKLVGRVEEDKRYKPTGASNYGSSKQLYVTKYVAIRPETKEGVIKYLKTIKGISKVKASQIYNAFGADSIEVLMHDPARVIAEIPKVGEKTALKWQKEIKLSIEVNAMLVNLMDYGLTMKEAEKLYKIFGDEVVEKIESNPYILIEHARGFGFEKCDKIAMKVGISPSSPFRLQEGILHALKLESLKGHCFLPMDELLKKAKDILDIKLSFNEMEHYIVNNSEDEIIIHSVGKEVFPIEYSLLARYYNRYKHEEYQSRKPLHRYPILEFSEAEIELEANELIINQQRLVLDDKNVYLRDLYEAEVAVAERVINLCSDSSQFKRDVVVRCLNEITKEQGVELEGMQEQACIVANLQKGGFFILNGSAGTGKTFTLNILLELAKKVRLEYGLEKPKILAFAPTGKASKVASKSIGMDCQTIHKGLGFNPESGGFVHNKSNPFKANIIVCDETSMLDIKMAKHFLNAIKDGTKVVFMGDTKQLASVGAGNVLKDLIESEEVPVVTLNVVKRQGKQSGIVANANRIIDKQLIQNPGQDDPRDSFFLEKYADSSCRKTIIESIHRIINNIKIEFDEIQVLSPQRSGALGVWALNHLIQKEFNPYDAQKHKITVPTHKFKIKIDGKDEQELSLSFRAGDKVINTRNNYDLEHYSKDFNGDLILMKEETGITNGECGVIESIEQVVIEDDGKETTSIKMVVKYDDFYAVYLDDFQDLEHSYCMTIHKSQGSAWKAVVMPVSKSHTNMLDNNLIYTGWTRAREFAVAVGNKEALSRGVNKSNATKRYTSLSTRIAENMSKMA